MSLQLAILVVVWAGFLFTQMQKAKYNHCTWQFAALTAAQVLVLAGVTAATLLYETLNA